MDITVNIPDDAFCDDCPFYVESDDYVDICNYIDLYSTDDDDDPELLEYVKLKGLRGEKRVKSDDCPNKIGVEAKRKLKDIKTEIFEIDGNDDDDDDDVYDEDDE
jgi:hypothetical protein